nr:hypothetical protein CFP56_45895 [Quercus suber]
MSGSVADDEWHLGVDRWLVDCEKLGFSLTFFSSIFLLARLFTKRRVNLEALTRTLRSIWHFVQNFEVRDLGSNTVLIIFDDEAAPQKILSQGPWSFDKYLVGLYRAKDKESVDDATFVGASFWVQFHNLPLRRMNKATAEAIGKTLGTVEQVDASLSGDFNVITSQYEKSGGCQRLTRQMNRFCQAIHLCNFIDLGYVGSPYTWSRNHPIEGRTHIHLDKALATTTWKSLFPSSTVHHISMSSSDHSLIAIHLHRSKPQKLVSRPLFRFEAMWLQDPRCAEVVQDAWHEGLSKAGGTPITNCLDNCCNHLTVWNKNEFSHVGKHIERLDKKLQCLEQDPIRNNAEIQEQWPY